MWRSFADSPKSQQQAPPAAGGSSAKAWRSERSAAHDVGLLIAHEPLALSQPRANHRNRQPAGQLLPVAGARSYFHKSRSLICARWLQTLWRAPVGAESFHTWHDSPSTSPRCRLPLPWVTICLHGTKHRRKTSGREGVPSRVDGTSSCTASGSSVWCDRRLRSDRAGMAFGGRYMRNKSDRGSVSAIATLQHGWVRVSLAS
jgi:hypothetical protein